jgi:hypothetical protein
MPGTSARISLPAQPRKFAKAILDGKPAEWLLAGKTLDVSFPGRALKQPWHRKLTDLKAVEVPADAGALYEATCYAAASTMPWRFVRSSVNEC